MSKKIKDLNYFEEKHTEYARNSSTFDKCYTGKHVYVVNRKDEEYGYMVFCYVAYTFDDAIRLTTERIIKRNNNYYSYNNWLLVGSEDEEDFWDFITEGDGVNSNYEYEDFHIFAYGDDGKEIDSVALFANKTYIGGQQ